MRKKNVLKKSHNRTPILSGRTMGGGKKSRLLVPGGETTVQLIFPQTEDPGGSKLKEKNVLKQANVINGLHAMRGLDKGRELSGQKGNALG